MDDPGHHTVIGDRLLNEGQAQRALDSYERGLSLKQDFVPALAGKAVALAMLKQSPEAKKIGEKAKRLSMTPPEEAHLYTSMIRMYVLLRDSEANWYTEAQTYYARARQIAKTIPPEHLAPAHYFMGEAHFYALEFARAKPLFREVIDLKTRYVQEADQRWAFLQLVERASPGTRTGRRIALVTQMTRGDVSALFIEELNLAQLFTKKGPKQPAAFQPPDEHQSPPKPADNLPADVKDHPLRESIGKILSYKVHGLQPFKPEHFAPNKTITRAEYALMLEDILSRLRQDLSLNRKFLKSPSPFSDVRADHYSFNAIMVCTTQNFLPASKDGLFRPLEPVLGIDALLSIRYLKQFLKIE
jgi:tetratricopeptide (TPR) repeat protein